ncbi:MAG: hypothetical protein KME60_19830 [Cyanomargarita calcarea GSE-NOS-MK-12-04C]|uniref:Uncharacterized protein n=1 Tax=Cyanomargarita calcarea GSE-NOS-MK-12-04C TaxID=2839659 RepID=A0A951UUA6_9CYAN|nr:hypothetical protein [Cyanomargarita calcarea GSE-NOS-MK-12-04C]
MRSSACCHVTGLLILGGMIGLNEGRRKREEGRRKKEVFRWGLGLQLKTDSLNPVGVLNPQRG